MKTFSAYRYSGDGSANAERTAHATEYQAEKLDEIADLLARIEKVLGNHAEALQGIEKLLSERK